MSRRPVLADRLRRRETLGLVTRGDGVDPQPASHLTTVGEGLMATLGSWRAWADTWLPDDPDMLERDPDVVLGRLAQQVAPDQVPGRPVVLELLVSHRPRQRYWLVPGRLTRRAWWWGALISPLVPG